MADEKIVRRFSSTKRKNKIAITIVQVDDGLKRLVKIVRVLL